MKFLAFDTSTHLCSVAVYEDTKCLHFEDVSDDNYTHAEKLHLSIDHCLKKAGITPSELDFIAVGKGPGSYTGLRIGISAAKGMAYALNKPIIAINSLQILSAAAIHELGKPENSDYSDGTLLVPMIDARRMEVYTCCYSIQLKPITAIEAKIIESNSFDLILDPFYYFGDGAKKCAEVIVHPGAKFLPGIKPSARFMGEIALELYKSGSFEDTAYFEPFYLKEFIAGKAKAVMP